MKQIAIIAKDIREELEGAEHYAKLATMYKDTDKTLADTYATMASQELVHVDALHGQAVRLIREFRAEGNTPPAGMQAVWDWEHEKMVEDMTRVKMMLDIYKK